MINSNDISKLEENTTESAVSVGIGKNQKICFTAFAEKKGTILDLPGLQQIEVLETPKNSEGYNTQGIDNKIVTFNLEERFHNKLPNWTKNNLDEFNNIVDVSHSDGEVSALNYDYAFACTDTVSNPILTTHQLILSALALELGVNIETSAEHNNFLFNYFGWTKGTKKDFYEHQSNLNCRSTFFNKKEIAKKNYHIDEYKEENKFNFTLAIFFTSPNYSKHYGKGFVFPAELPSEDLMIPLEPNNLKVVIFPSYTQHGTEAWKLDSFNQNANTLIRAFRQYKNKAKFNRTQNPHPFDYHHSSDDDINSIEKFVDNYLDKIMEGKFLDDAKDNKLNKDLFYLDNKVQCFKQISNKLNVSVVKNRLKKRVDQALSATENQLNQLLITQFPYRCSAIWRGNMHAEGMNTEQIAMKLFDRFSKLNTKEHCNKEDQVNFRML